MSLLEVIALIILALIAFFIIFWNKWEIIEPQTIVINRETLQIVEVYNSWWIRLGSPLEEEQNLITISFRSLSFHAEHTIGDVKFNIQGTYLGTPESARWLAEENLRKIFWVKWKEEFGVYLESQETAVTRFNNEEKEAVIRLMFTDFLVQKWPELNINVTKIKITFKKEV